MTNSDSPKITDDGHYLLYEPASQEALTVKSDFGGRYENRNEKGEWIQIFLSNLRSEEPLRIVYSNQQQKVGLSVGIHPQSKESIVHEGRVKTGRYLRIEAVPVSVAGHAHGPTTEIVIATPDVRIDRQALDRALLLVADVMRQRSRERRPADLVGVAVPKNLVKKFL